jgi:hypothetical protein
LCHVHWQQAPSSLRKANARATKELRAALAEGDFSHSRMASISVRGSCEEIRRYVIEAASKAEGEADDCATDQDQDGQPANVGR